LETVVHSKKYLYAGTVDAVAIEKQKDEAGNEVVKTLMFDWKTSNAIYENNALQLAAYAIAWEEMYGIKIDAACVVRINKDKKGVQVKTVKDPQHSFEAFKAALFLYNSLSISQFVKLERKNSKNSGVDSGEIDI